MSSKGISIALSITAVIGAIFQIAGIVTGFELWKKGEFLFLTHMFEAHAVLSAIACSVGTVLCLVSPCFSNKTILFGVVIFPSYLLSAALLSPWTEVFGMHYFYVLYVDFITSTCLVAVGSAIIITIGIIYLVLTLREVITMQNQIQVAETSRYQPHVTPAR